MQQNAPLSHFTLKETNGYLRLENLYIFPDDKMILFIYANKELISKYREILQDHKYQIKNIIIEKLSTRHFRDPIKQHHHDRNDWKSSSLTKARPSQVKSKCQYRKSVSSCE